MSLNYVRAGSGPPLVLIHGLGGSLVVWEPVIDLLAKERDVTAVDLPGFGDSDPLPEGTRHSAHEMGRAVAAHLESLGIVQPHLAGNSLGAWTALEMAADGKAASLCCISPAGLWRRKLGPRTYNTRKLGRRGRIAINGMLRTERGRRALMRTTVARPELLSADEAIRWLSAWLDAPAYDDANDMMRATPFERAREIDVPVTIAWARRIGWSPRRAPSGCRPAPATSRSRVGATPRPATTPRESRGSCLKPARYRPNKSPSRSLAPLAVARHPVRAP